jgi:hypothetical protein
VAKIKGDTFIAVNNKTWSLDIVPVYEDREPFFDGVVWYGFPLELRYLRVAVKYDHREVIVFHAVRPASLGPISGDQEDDYIFSYKRLVDPDNNPHNLDLNPLKQLIDDAELGRRVREAGLGMVEGG